jgi:pimeloyl-ACP methyl ester carboxylesterase
VSYDARGYGASGGTYTLEHVEHLDVEAGAERAMGRGVPTILVGASLGGVAALRYAGELPELAGAVIVSSPAKWQIPLRLRAVLTVALVRTRPGRRIARRRMGVRISSEWTATDPLQVLTDRVTSPSLRCTDDGTRSSLFVGVSSSSCARILDVTWFSPTTWGMRSIRKGMMQLLPPWTGPLRRTARWGQRSP